MALIVNTNSASMKAMNHLGRSTRNLTSSFQHISSGLRINSAADDAAGLAVAENLDADKGSMRQALRNVHDGISIVQTQEGATSEVGDILKRMRELAVQSSSETLANSERSYVQDEFSALTNEIDRIANVTEFNGIALTNSEDEINVQVGISGGSNDRIAIFVNDLRTKVLEVDAANVNVSSAVNAQAAITSIDDALEEVNVFNSDSGSAQNRLEAALNNLETFTQNIAVAESRIRDADFAYETAEMSKHQIMQQAGIAVVGQANGLAQGALRLI